ncbi:hypothetical protein BBBOND_0110750 [Babesia bigemina]|uniref:Uncharacterized protein n=1 Tax=Babesia bigemina TaxID=5866 RepID=A0A061D2F6_BABBI|nr:hypothetical protein BBBOND_0110750 [Babesia bigemina]CDR94778.1 hypothetical protein BBBOND_0110750 [Babesia bigemina]|eukprot:XP_012766964.1 hypothetical protein BBBOND_0110750 [Babesia bigemina]
MKTQAHCRNTGKCAYINELDKRHIHLGTFDNTRDNGPLVITVRKSKLEKRLVYAVTALSKVLTGNFWMSIGIMNSKEHQKADGQHQKYFNGILTKEFMERTLRFGQSAHGIETLSFVPSNIKYTVEDLKRLKGYPDGAPSGITPSGEAVEHEFKIPEVDGPEMSKGSIIINPEVDAGNYYLEFAYGNPDKGPKMVCFKEVIVKVVPY